MTNADPMGFDPSSYNRCNLEQKSDQGQGISQKPTNPFATKNDMTKIE
jgi:hypothetical protein